MKMTMRYAIGRLTWGVSAAIAFNILSPNSGFTMHWWIALVVLAVGTTFGDVIAEPDKRRTT